VRGAEPAEPEAQTGEEDRAAPELEQLPAPYREKIQKESEELERLRRGLERAGREAKSYAARETKLLRQLNELDEGLSLRKKLLAELARKERELGERLEETRARLEHERARLEERRTILRRRLRNIYKVGEKPGLQVLLGASSAVDLVRRFDWLLLVAAQDRMLYENILESVEVVRQTEEELQRQMEEIRSIRAEKEREKEELARKRRERKELLHSVRTKRQRHEKLVRELEEAEKELQRVLAELEERARSLAQRNALPPGGTGFAAAKGKLPWPVRGKVTRWFGLQKDERFGTSTFNGGIDIQAEKNAKVIAVHRGRADYVNWLPGYGQCIILSHGDGYYTLYAHTSSVYVKVGDIVEAGEVIASVGDTGSFFGDVLHFEIRKDAEPINPAPWLRPTELR
jgi:septal ring factor EnvC (AmiA/AmiB activator)